MSELPVLKHIGERRKCPAKGTTQECFDCPNKSCLKPLGLFHVETNRRKLKAEPDDKLATAGHGAIVGQTKMIELAANLMGLAQSNMRNDLVRIATQEFDYIVRRRREIQVDYDKFVNIMKFLELKEAALKNGEFDIDTISGQITFWNADLQPWL
jgi:hypothetical protein